MRMPWRLIGLLALVAVLTTPMLPLPASAAMLPPVSATVAQCPSWLAGRYGLLTRAAGVILVAIGVFGTWTEVLP